MRPRAATPGYVGGLARTRPGSRRRRRVHMAERVEEQVLNVLTHLHPTV